MPNINPDIPANSVQYFSNARGVYYLPSLENEWLKSGYLPRIDYESGASISAAAALDGKAVFVPDSGTDFTVGTSPADALKVFTGSNGASIWHYYNESDHEKGVVHLKELGINCIRTPLNFSVYNDDPAKFLSNVKSFLSVCDRHKIRVQFILWDAEESRATLFDDTGVYSEPTSVDLPYSLAVEQPRNPCLSQASSTSFFSDSAGPYLDALAGAVSSYLSMWSFDLCNKPVYEFFGLSLSSHSRLNLSLSTTPIKYSFSPKNGLSIFNDTNYLDNGKGTGPSGSFDYLDIQVFSEVVDFISIPFIANNKYAFNRYLNGAIEGTTSNGISKPFMVYAAYDPEVAQSLSETLDVLDDSSVGYMTDLGIVDSAFSFGKHREKFGNIYWDGQYRDSNAAETLTSDASRANWYTGRQLRKSTSLEQKPDDQTNSIGGFFSGTPPELASFNSELYVSATDARWSYLKDIYINPGPNLETAMLRVKEGSKTFKAPFTSEYNDSVNHSILAASLYSNSLEENLNILYNFDTYFPALSSYEFSISGDKWQTINETMIIRNGFLQSLSEFVVDYDSTKVPYAELRNSVYDPNPIPHYEREELIELVEVMTNPHRYVNRNPTTSKLLGLASTRAYEFADALYGDPDSGTDFSTYYDTYYRDFVAQLKKCLMWIYREGTTNPDFKIVSDSFLNDISFEASCLTEIEVYPITPLVNESGYVADSLSSLESPTYSVDVYDPTTKSWASSFVFQASGTGGHRQILGQQVDGIYSSLRDYWAPSGSNPPCHFTTFGVSGVAKIRIKRLGVEFSEGASMHVFPSRSSKTREFLLEYGDLLDDIYFTGDVYIGDKLWLEFTDNDLNVSSPLFIFADPFKPPIPEGIGVYNGETRIDHLGIAKGQTVPNLNGVTDAWQTINWGSPGNPTYFSSLQPPTYFGPGIHYVSAGLPISPNSTYYIDANAYIIGGFDCASGHSSEFIGRGTIAPGHLYSRDFITNVKLVGYEEAPHFYGNFGTSWSSMDEYAVEYQNTTQGLPEITVNGITTTNQHFWASGRNIIKEFNHCKALVPWTYNTDGFKPGIGKVGETATIKNSLEICGDDVVSVWSNKFRGEVYTRNVSLGVMRTGVLHGFVANASAPYYTVNKDIDIYSYAAPGGHPNFEKQSFSRNAIFMFYDAEPSGLNYTAGRVNGVFEDISIEGGDGHPLYLPLFRVGNTVKPSNGSSIPPCGLESNIQFTNINVTPSAYPPSSLEMSSTIIGLSATSLPGQSPQPFNRPQDLTITNLKINQSPETFFLPENMNTFMSWYEPLSGTNSVTDPYSVDGADAGISVVVTKDQSTEAYIPPDPPDPPEPPPLPQIDPNGPGDESYRSTKFEVTVSGVSAFVYGESRITQFETAVWDADEAIEQSVVRFGVDDDWTTVVVSLPGGATLSAATVYPKNIVTGETVSDNKLTMQVPTGSNLRIEVNDERGEVLSLASRYRVESPIAFTDYTEISKSVTELVGAKLKIPSHGIPNNTRAMLKSETTLPPTVSGTLSEFEPVTVYTLPNDSDNIIIYDSNDELVIFSVVGEQEGLSITPAKWDDTDNTLVIPSGVHNIGRLFELSDSTNVYLDEGAVAIGSFRINCSGSKIYGPGLLHGGYADAYDVWGLPSESKYPYSMFYAEQDGSGLEYSNTVEDIIVLSQPHFLNYGGVKLFKNVCAVAPWNWNADGYTPVSWFAYQPILGVGEVINCYGLFGDDGFKWRIKQRSMEISGCFLTVTNNACYSVDSRVYHGNEGNYFSATDCHAMHLGTDDLSNEASKVIFKGLCDGYIENPEYGQYNVTFDNLKVWGPMNSRIFCIGNFANPFQPARDQAGQSAFWKVKDLWVESVPAQNSWIKSLDAVNTPHDIEFINFQINNTLVTDNSYTTHMEVDPLVYNLVFTDPSLQIDALGPGNEGYRSTKFEVTVDDSSAFVYGETRVTQFPTDVWDLGASVEQSVVQYGTDGETKTVEISMVGGTTLSAATVYPKNVVTGETIADNKLTMNVPTNVRLRIEINDDRSEVLSLFSNPRTGSPASFIDYTTLGKEVEAVTNSRFTITSYGWETGTKVIMKGSGGLPTPTAGTLSEFEILTLSYESRNTFTLIDSDGITLQFGIVPAGLTITPAQWTDTENTLVFPAGVHTLAGCSN